MLATTNIDKFGLITKNLQWLYNDASLNILSFSFDVGIEEDNGTFNFDLITVRNKVELRFSTMITAHDLAIVNRMRRDDDKKGIIL